MFDIGWTELIVIACVAILVVGPKDLPGMLRNVGKAIRSLRKMTGDFQRQFDEALKEAELDDITNLAKSKSFQPLEDAKKSMEAYQKKVSAELNTPFGEDGPSSDDKSADALAKSDKPKVDAKPATRAASGPAARKAEPKKTEPKKTEAKKTLAKKPASGKTAVKKPAIKKAAAQKPPAAKATRAKTQAKKPKSSSAATGTSA